MAYPCAVPGINLSDYSTALPRAGWGPRCTGPFARVTINSAGAGVTVDARIAELVSLIMRRNEADGYHYRPADTGAQNCRLIAGTNVWSLHSWGVAIDENWSTNPYTSPLRTDKPGWLVQRWNRYGFAWGGHYNGSKDAMHFEFMGTPGQAVQSLALARVELGAGAPPPPPPPTGGDVQIRADQHDLNDSGFPVGAEDGVWGPVCIAACKQFQHAAHLTEDGEMGPVTRGAIHKVPSWRGSTVGDGGYPARQWQQKLKDHGWRIDVDNAWGPHSTSILRQFQADKGLNMRRDGARCSESWACLYTTVN